MKNDLDKLRGCRYCDKPFLRLPDHPSHAEGYCSVICQNTANREAANIDAPPAEAPPADAPPADVNIEAGCYRTRG